MEKKMNKSRWQKKMLILIGSLSFVFGAILLFWYLPFSQTKTEFNRIAAGFISEASHSQDVFSEADIAALPAPIQRYFRSCGYLGQPKMSYLKIEYPDVDFIFSKDQPTMKIAYTQYNFLDELNRIAYIDSAKYGIPFEGLDAFLGGSGSMKGVLAKIFTLFDQKGQSMDQASLVTYLSESLFLPSAALQDSIEWEAMDDLHAKATLNAYGMSVSGVFGFDPNGEMRSFLTADRSAVASDGSSQKLLWSVTCGEYSEENGLKRPTSFQAIWHYADGDSVYFNGKGVITTPTAP